MTVSSYRPQSWNFEPLSNDKLNQMTQNDQYLFEHLPTTIYQYNQNGGNGAYAGPKRDSGIRIYGGWVRLPVTNTTRSTFQLNFGDVFTPGTFPSIVVSGAPFVAVGNGLTVITSSSLEGPNRYITDRGCLICATVPTGYKLTGAVLVHFIAYGI